MTIYFKKVFCLLLAISCVGLMIAAFVSQPKIVGASTDDFAIKLFEADYYLSRNDQNISTLKVVEKITAQFPDFDQNHGILRYIPKVYQGHSLSLDVEQVLLNGNPVDYVTSSPNDNVMLRIGDADSFVRGEQTYTISYTMRNVVEYLDDHEEFYWDINGDQWPQMFEKIIARIHLDSSIAGALQNETACYTGYYGRNGRNCLMVVAESNGQKVVTVKASELGSRQTLTAVLGFTKGTFSVDPAIAREASYQNIKKIVLALVGFAIPLGTIMLIVMKWFKYGRDPEGKGIIIPEYVPPKGVSLLAGSMMLNEQLDNKAISATLLDLAVRGYVVIYEIPKKGFFGKVRYEVELVKAGQDLTTEEQRVLTMFFGGSDSLNKRVNISELKATMYSHVENLVKFLSKNLAETGYFSKNPLEVRRSYSSRGIFLAIAGFMLLIGIGSLWPIGAGLIVSGVILLVSAPAMPARTKQGVMVRENLLGLKDYIKMAEADRIKFLQSPEGAEKVAASFDPEDPAQKVKLFEKLLPYAMLFGLEKQWAKEFQDLYTQPPDWYQGNWTSFNAVYLASSVNNFGAASTPSAPNSSGSSGLGGGGFSGGGGGGGGGGGW